MYLKLAVFGFNINMVVGDENIRPTLFA